MVTVVRTLSILLAFALQSSAVVAATEPSEPAPETTAAASTTVAPPSPPIVSAEAWAAFDQIASDRLVDRGDLAAGVAVSVDGQLVHTAAFGRRTPLDPVDHTVPTDRFRIASISKFLTAVTVLRLVDAGELGLDEPVAARLAASLGVGLGSDGWASVTVRQLLSHTAGVPKYRGEFFGGSFTSCEGAAVYGLTHGLDRTPGTAHVYSNLNFCLLGLLIADITGRSYDESVNVLVLRPLGIRGMRTVGTYEANLSEVVHASGPGRVYMEALGGAGAWVATPADLVRVVDSLDTTRPGWHPLSAELAAMMPIPMAGVSFPDPGARTYGLGTIVWPDGSWGHSGTVESTHAMVAHRPDGVTWSILVSGETPSDTESLRDVFDGALAGAGITLTAPG